MYKIFTQYRNMRVFKKIIKYYTKKYISETHKKGTLKILNDLFYLTLIKKKLTISLHFPRSHKMNLAIFGIHLTKDVVIFNLLNPSH